MTAATASLLALAEHGRRAGEAQVVSHGGVASAFACSPAVGGLALPRRQAGTSFLVLFSRMVGSHAPVAPPGSSVAGFPADLPAGAEQLA